MEPVTVVYVITAVVSIVTALVLVNLARLSAQARVRADEERMKNLASAPASEEVPATDIDKTIFKEISSVVDSAKDWEKISKKISHIISSELDKKVGAQTSHIKQQYETLLEEKAKNEQMAWGKYEKVLSEKKETEAVIHSIAEGLVVVDKNGNVIMLNQAAEKLLGSGKKDKIGRPIFEGLKEEQLVSMVKSSSDKDNKEIELISQHNDTKKIIRASSAIIEDENGQTVGMVSVLSDITKQKELDALKANFVANVSHELRTPLVGIEKSVTLILSKAAGVLTENQEQLLSIAQRNLKRLTLLINDLLDLSKLEAGKMDIRRQPSSISKVIDESMENLYTWANTKGIKLEKHVQNSLPEVNVDPNRITQVLTNLIGNSIKFTPKDGTISIGACLNNNALEVTVQDTGIGIPREAIGKIFDKFYQVGERTPSDISGTGIGLSVSKEIVEQHGGRIWAESQHNAGAKFIFTIPL